MPVNVTGLLQLQVGSKEVCMILTGFLDGALSNWHTQYICDALQMAEGVTFTNENIRDALDCLTDLELGGEIDIQDVSKIRNAMLCGYGAACSSFLTWNQHK